MVVTAPQAEEVRLLRSGRLRPIEIAAVTGLSVRTVQAVLAGAITGRPLSARDQFEEDARTGWAPLCMNADEWAEWRRTNPLGLSNGAIARPCEDCLLGFAADMRAGDSCNGAPGGVHPEEETEEEPMDQVSAPAGIRVEVAVEAPCPRCEKADVCGLRETVEGLKALPVMTPRLDPRVGLALAGTVTCSAFVKARIRKADIAELETSRKVAYGAPRLSARQAQILDAVVRHGANRRDAAEELGALLQTVDSALVAIAQKGLIPHELEIGLPERMHNQAATS